MAFNEEQQRIIDFREGFAVVAAGAGSGKTTTLVARTDQLVKEGVDPKSILVLAFNSKAGGELRHRLAAKLDTTFENLQVAAGTFHAWGRGRIHEVYGKVGKPKPTLLKGAVAHALIQKVILTLWWKGASDAEIKKLQQKIPSKTWLDICSQARDALCWMLPETRLNDQKIMEQLPAFDQLELPTSPIGTVTASQVWEVLRAYTDAKKEINQIDFSDMLWIPSRLIHDRKSITAEWGKRYSHVMIDECQDSNPSRFLIGDYCSQGAQSYMNVGDLRQSIYSFTGARPDLYVMPLPPANAENPIGGMGVRELLPGIRVSAQLLTLRVNYRSGKSIVEMANNIARGKPWNLGGEAIAARDSNGEIESVNMGSGTETALQILNEVAASDIADESGGSCCAVLSRTRAGLLPVRIIARQKGIKVKTLSNEGTIWDSAMALDVLAYLEASDGVYTNITRIAWKGRTPRYFKGPVFAQVKAQAGDLAINLVNSSDRALSEFGDLLLQLQGMSWTHRCNLISDILGGYFSKENNKAQTAEDLSAVDTIEALCQAADLLGSREQIEEVKKEEEAEHEANQRGEDSGPALVLSTLHSSKGLEWSKVWIVNASRGTIPHPKSDNLEEEHRLFYVGVTRAKNRLILCHAGDPTVFLDNVLPQAKRSHATHAISSEEMPPPALELEDPVWAAVALWAAQQDKAHKPSIRRLDLLLSPLGFTPVEGSDAFNATLNGTQAAVMLGEDDTVIVASPAASHVVANGPEWRTEVINHLAALAV